MRILSCFFILIFAAGVISCTGDDETITIKTEQCYNGTTVNVTEGEECPTPPPPTTGNGDMGGGDAGGGDAGGGDDGSTGGECNLNATGKAPFNGSSGDDVICGDGDNNTISALGGEDIVRAKGGNDTVDGGPGNDELYGEAGDDILTGGEDEDVVDGGPGNDTLIGSEGRDKLIGGEGSDTVRYIGCTGFETDGSCTSGNEVALTINLANGYSKDEDGDQDTYVGIENVETGPGEDEITGDENANRIDGGGGQPSDGKLLDGGGGADTLIVGVTTQLGEDSTTGPNNIRFENLEARLIARAGVAAVTASLNLTGDSKANVIKGGNNGGTLAGMGGNDRLYAGTGGSTLQGGVGDDTLVGGAGVDNLIGGIGRDTLTGNEGNDCFLFQIESPVVVTDRVTDFGEGDLVSVTGTPPASLAQEGGGLSVQARSGNVVIVETYDHDNDNDAQTPDRVTNRATVATVGSKLADATTIGTNCPQ